jgi:hypothetical protein
MRVVRWVIAWRSASISARVPAEIVSLALGRRSRLVWARS